MPRAKAAASTSSGRSQGPIDRSSCRTIADDAGTDDDGVAWASAAAADTTREPSVADATSAPTVVQDRER